MADPQLWCVEVTQTWEASGIAWVWADSQRAATRAAEAEVELDWVDATEDTSSMSRRVPFTDLERIKPVGEWLLMPDGSEAKDIDEFRSVLTPEMQFVLQRREWERNGQLVLEVARG